MSGLNADGLGFSQSIFGNVGTDSNPSRVYPQSPNCIVYEDSGGTSHAVAEWGKFTGTDIFDAAQQAIDVKLGDGYDGQRSGAGSGGRIHVIVQPDTYSGIETQLSITEKSAEHIAIYSPVARGAVLVPTQNFADDEPLIKIDPDAGEAGLDRIRNVRLYGFDFDAENRTSRNVDGLFVNDVNFLRAGGMRFWNGFRNGLHIKNTWQAYVHYLILRECGSDSASLPAIKVSEGSSSGASKANNHHIYDHLQGDPGGTGFEYAYFEATGQASRMEIRSPNPELNDTVPGFKIGTTDGAWNVVNPNITGGDPAFDVTGPVQVTFDGGYILAGNTAISGSSTGNAGKIVIGNIQLNSENTSGSAPVVDMSDGIIVIGGATHVEGGERGIVIDDAQFVNLSDSVVRNINQACVKITNTSDFVTNINNLGLAGAGGGENPLYLDNVDDAVISNISAFSGSSVDAVRAANCDNTIIDGIVATGSLTGTLNDAGGNTFATR